MDKKTKQVDPKLQKTFLKLFYTIFIFPFVILLLLLFLITIGLFGDLPTFEELENPKSNLASEIFSSDQQVLGNYNRENRTLVDFEEISPNVLNALIATEDIRFYDHSGIDGLGILRVLVKTILFAQEESGGGSTITQQLAKNLFPRDTTKESSRIVKMTKTGIAKLKEWITAIKLERNYTKDEIMVMYLNKVSFGSNAFGIKSAALTFFGKEPNALNVEEAATLIGMLKAPSKFNPKFREKRSINRRNTVIDQIEKYKRTLRKVHGYKPLSSKQYDSIRALPMKLSYRVSSHTEGISTYFREFLRMKMTAKKPDSEKYNDMSKFREDSISWLTDPLYGWCNKHKKPNGENYDLYSDGIKIYTTINSKMQKYAEEAVFEHLGKGKNSLQKSFENDIKRLPHPPYSWELPERQFKEIMWRSVKRSKRYWVLNEAGYDSTSVMRNFKTKAEMTVFSWRGERDTIMTPWDSILYYKKFLQAGFMAVEPQTGFVRAYVGGINQKHFQYDHVTQSRRQVGSTIKPFVYALAMVNGLSPCYKIPNVPVTFVMPKGQDPPTYTPKFTPNNRYDGKMITLRTGLAGSFNQVSAWILKQFNPQAVIDIARKMGVKSPLPPVPSLCVGAPDISLAEMVGAYGTFPNKGMYVEPIYVIRIEDKIGNEISRFATKKNEAISGNVAYKMVNLMQGVVDFGTGANLRLIYGFVNEIAGKTGTTNDQSDGWFIGYVPNLVAGGWVGGEERSIRFSEGFVGQGSTLVLPIWAYFMKRVYADGTLGVTKDPFTKPDGWKDIDCGKEENIEDPYFYEEEKY